MPLKDFIQKLKYVDTVAARWLQRLISFTFFQLVLFVIFMFWFINMLDVIDIKIHSTNQTLIEEISTTQTVNLTIISAIVLINSFWMLFLLNSMQRLANLLKDVSYNINRLRSTQKRQP